MSGSERISVVEGRAMPLAGDDIDTDRIIPARYLRAISFEGLEQHVFEDERKTMAHPFDDPRFVEARVLVVQRNFGCGSSREHAPQALHRWGIRAIVGESFSDIFFGNAAMMGMPCVTARRGDIDALIARVEREPERTVRVDLEALTLQSDGMTFPIAMPPNAREAFVTGTWDTTGMLLDRYEDVRQVASRLPYVTGFSAPPRA
jgi:3-isopropylmalate/(R)-2-methylmalate dehydratase small subunit